MRDERLYENLKLWTPGADECDGQWQIPKLSPMEAAEIETWKPFSIAMTSGAGAHTGVQMYVHDYRLARLWNDPQKYVELVTGAGCVLTPDYSVYIDVPAALNLYSHYRKHWLGAWWQRFGATVIPTICWADEASFAWCFDGEPVGGTVSVSSVGTQRAEDDKRRFMRGYDAMLERLQPKAVLFFGNVPKECRGNIVPLETYYKQIERRRKERWAAEARQAE